MARWLAARGYPVQMLTWDEGQPDEIEIDGVRVFKICRLDGGLVGLRFFHPRWTGLVRAMRRADADLYYLDGNSWDIYEDSKFRCTEGVLKDTIAYIDAVEFLKKGWLLSEYMDGLERGWALWESSVTDDPNWRAIYSSMDQDPNAPGR